MDDGTESEAGPDDVVCIEPGTTRVVGGNLRGG
jgi:hypothetical protein